MKDSKWREDEGSKTFVSHKIEDHPKRIAKLQS